MIKHRENTSVKKGDKVYVLSGNDRGQTGEVLSRDSTRAVVQGVNVRKKCVKRSDTNPQGGFISIERPIHLSKLKRLEEKK